LYRCRLRKKGKDLGGKGGGKRPWGAPLLPVPRGKRGMSSSNPFYELMKGGNKGQEKPNSSSSWCRKVKKGGENVPSTGGEGTFVFSSLKEGGKGKTSLFSQHRRRGTPKGKRHPIPFNSSVLQRGTLRTNIVRGG